MLVFHHDYYLIRGLKEEVPHPLSLSLLCEEDKPHSVEFKWLHYAVKMDDKGSNLHCFTLERHSVLLLKPPADSGKSLSNLHSLCLSS